MYENPVLWKELKTRLRSRQPAPVRAAIFTVVGLFIALCYYYVISNVARYSGRAEARDWWQLAVGIQALLIWLLCPALAVNAITQEKEQQTWQMLVFTLLTPFDILFGKLVSRLVPIVAILAAFLPFMLYAFAKGGASVGEFFVTYLVFTIWILFLVTVSLFMSWAFGRTAVAVAMSYMVLFALTIGTGLAEWMIGMGRDFPDSPIIWLNPVRIVAAMNSATDTKATAVMLVSHLSYLGCTALLFMVMVSRFRAMRTE